MSKLNKINNKAKVVEKQPQTAKYNVQPAHMQGVQVNKPEKKKNSNTSSARTVSFEQGLKSNRSKLAKMDGWAMVKQLIGKENTRSIKYMVSPGDGMPSTGMPDGVFSSSGVLNLTAVHKVACPTNQAFQGQDTWNLSVLTFPSPDLPALLVASPGSSNNLFGATSTSSGIVANFHEPTGEFYPTPDTIIAAAQVVVLPLKFPTFKHEIDQGPDSGSHPFGRTPSYLGNFFAGDNVGIGFQHFATPTHLSAIGSTVDEEIRSFRCLGSSLTGHLVADAFSNRGIVYSKRLKPILRNEIASIWVNGTDPGSSETRTGCSTSRVVYPADLPYSMEEFVSNSPYYVGEASDGSYTVSCYYPTNSATTATREQRSVVCFPRQDGTGHATFSALTDFSSGQPRWLPVSCLMDYNFCPTVTCYRGISKLASVELKLKMGLEIAALPSSPYAAVIHESPELNVTYHDIVLALMRHVQPGYPASYNDFWTELKKIKTTAFDILKEVGPIISLMLKML